MSIEIDQFPNEDEEISLSPLIDCVFLLLIYFLVATMFKKDDKDINIDLPVSRSALEMAPDDDIIMLGVNKKGILFHQGIETDLNELKNVLRHLSIDQPETSFRLDCDQNAPFYRIVEVLDMCQFMGFKDIGIRTYDEQYNR
jgi:biopolymer transport protein ExbD